jgi:S-formylglutathione hydrolase FrmB
MPAPRAGLRRLTTVATALAALNTLATARQTAPSAPAAAPAARSVEVSVTYDEAVADSFTGRVYLMISRSDRREPRHGPSWFGTEPFFALDVEDWRPGEPLVFDDRAIGFPGRLSAVAPAAYTFQAVMRRNLDAPTIGTAPGNAYSATRRARLDAEDGTRLDLRIRTVVPDRRFHESDRLRLVELRSELLSAFHGRNIVMRAAVILPEGWDAESDRRYPTQYWIGGFSSTHTGAPWIMQRGDATGFGDRIARVVPDPSCYGGHHVFADSANNGPWGRALVEELIPHLERTYPLVAAPWGRFLGGHSSGGWSSLWLQVTHPEFFGGVWSVAPDPVDFRDFQQIDLYAPGANMYRDQDGRRRPLARNGEQVMIWYEDFARMEIVYGEGGQLRSFEWVFSPRGADGLPRPLYDRETGAVDLAVARAWEAYDIRLQLERSWARLRDALAGKLHVFMGGLDTFYLDGATRRLKQSLAALGSDAVVEIVPTADHGSIATPALVERTDREMLEAFEAGGGA